MTKHKSVKGQSGDPKGNFCPQCGSRQSLDTKFCSNCGYDLLGVDGIESHTHSQKSKTHPIVWVLISIVIGFLAIGILSILASIVIVAINPTKQLSEARNAQRRADTNTIVNALYQYAIDHNGDLPTTIPQTPKEICRSEATNCAGLVDLYGLVGDYLIAVPSDPMTRDPRSTEYTIVYDSVDQTITVNAPNAEEGQSISASR